VANREAATAEAIARETKIISAAYAEVITLYSLLNVKVIENIDTMLQTEETIIPHISDSTIISSWDELKYWDYNTINEINNEIKTRLDLLLNNQPDYKEYLFNYLINKEDYKINIDNIRQRLSEISIIDDEKSKDIIKLIIKIKMLNILFNMTIKLYNDIDTIVSSESIVLKESKDYFYSQGGGSNNIINKQLLYNTVAAYLILKNKKTNIPNIKDLVITSIKLHKRIPNSKELLKSFVLPLFCDDKGVKVTVDNMTKCVNKNVHKLLDDKKIKDYIEIFDLSSKDKSILKEYDKRVNNINTVVKF
jgi:hypothetical protein